MSMCLIYMAKSSLCLLLFYVFFKALLSQDTFFRFNRFVLLSGIACCFILPLCRLTIPNEKSYLHEHIQKLEHVWVVTEDTGDISAQNNAVNLNEAKEEEIIDADRPAILTNLNFWLGFYIVGAAGVSIWYMISFFRIGNIIRTGKKLIFRGYKVVLTNNAVIPFSWGNYIVMSEADYREHPDEILLHEKMHIEKRHTLDLIYIELMLVFQWYNPVAWLLKKELQEIHEYEADKGVINHGIDATKYQLLLVKKAVGARLYSIANSFNHSKLKNRITMMLKEKSNHWARLKVALLLPLAAFMLFAFARTGTEGIIPSDQVFKVTQISDEPNQWDEEFFKLEYTKNALKFGLPQEYIGITGKENVIRMDQDGAIIWNKRLTSMSKLPEQLKNALKSRIGKQPVVTYILKEKFVSKEKSHDLLKLIGNAYQEVRQELADKSLENQDRQCPILVPVQNFVDLGQIPSDTTCVFVKMKGKGIKNHVFDAWDAKMFEEKLNQVENLKSYTVVELMLWGGKNDEMKNSMLNKLREKGITEVKFINRLNSK